MTWRAKYALALLAVFGLTATYTVLRDFNEIHGRYVKQEMHATSLRQELEGLEYREQELEHRVRAIEYELTETEAALRSIGLVRPGETVYRIRPRRDIE